MEENGKESVSDPDLKLVGHAKGALETRLPFHTVIIPATVLASRCPCGLRSGQRQRYRWHNAEQTAEIDF